MDAAGVVDSPENKMLKVEILRGLITERMTIAVREILAVVETTVAGYEDEVLLLKRELALYKRKLHGILQPQVHLNRLDLDAVGAPNITSSHSPDETDLRHVQRDAENSNCSASEKCEEEKGLGPSTTVSHEETLLEHEESDSTVTDLPSDSSVTCPAHREEGLRKDSVNDVEHTKVKRRIRLPQRYRSDVTDNDSDSYDDAKNSDKEWKPKDKNLWSSNAKKINLIKLRVGLLNNSSGTDLSNNALRLEGPVQTILCQQNLSQSDFIKQLRYTFPELGENNPFEAYLASSGNKSVPVGPSKMTHNELYKAFKSQGQKHFVFYLQRREHGDTCDTLTNTPLFFDEKPITVGLEEKPPVETEGSSHFMHEINHMPSTLDSAAQSEDDDGYWKPEQNDEDEHSTASESEKNISKETGEQRLNNDSCQVCGYLFKSLAILSKHALSHLDNPKCMCGVCGQQLESSEELKSHVETHQKLHHCDTCGQYFLRFQSLQRHITTHKTEKPFRCRICQNVFTSNELLKEHQLQHKVNKLYKCDICPQSFRFQSDFKIHYRKHTGDKLYCCDVCGKSLTTYRGLCQHKMIHSGEKNYSCKQCKKTFYTARFLKQHEKIHTVREKKYLCDICSKTFHTKRELEVHLKRHDESHIVKCPFCNKLVKGKGNLNYHMRIHTGERPYTCKECGKKFTLNNHLKVHMLIHLGVKPWTCTVCGYKCARKHYLDSHMRTHTGNKPYKCALCDKAFTQSHCLKTHMKSHHSQEQAGVDDLA